jgi:hypothetical protein
MHAWSQDLALSSWLAAPVRTVIQEPSTMNYILLCVLCKLYGK